MRYEVRRHTKPVLYHRGRYLVADMEHPERHPVIINKTMEEAEDFCRRLNAGERFWDSRGSKTYAEGLAEEYERLRNIVDAGGSKTFTHPWGWQCKKTVKEVTGLDWDDWVMRRTTRSRRALDLGACA